MLAEVVYDDLHSHNDDVVFIEEKFNVEQPWSTNGTTLRLEVVRI